MKILEKDYSTYILELSIEDIMENCAKAKILHVYLKDNKLIVYVTKENKS